MLVQNKATGALTLYENNWDAGAQKLTFTNRGVVTGSSVLYARLGSVYLRPRNEVDGSRVSAVPAAASLHAMVLIVVLVVTGEPIRCALSPTDA